MYRDFRDSNSFGNWLVTNKFVGGRELNAAYANDLIRTTDVPRLEKWILPVLERFSTNGDIAEVRDMVRAHVEAANAYADREVNKLLFAGIGAPAAIGGAAAAAPAILAGTAGSIITGGVALDYGQANLRGLLNGSFEAQGTLGGTTVSYLTNGRYGEGAYALGSLGLGGLGGAFTNAEGFLVGSVNVRAPFNIPVQRFGSIIDTNVQPWGLRIGSSVFANRTFAAILPEWNSLTNLTTAVIPRGTPMRFGIIGPQGFRYPGGSLQFDIVSGSAVQRSTTTIPR
jgi:hypothetical protein